MKNLLYSIKVSELKAFFKRLPTIETEDQQAFAKDIEDIRAQNKFEDKSWD